MPNGDKRETPSIYSRVQNKQTGRLLENEKNPTYSELYIYQFSLKSPTYIAIRLFPPIFIHFCQIG